jgi:hypothetical protein
MEFKGTKGEWKQRQTFENSLSTMFESGYECLHNEISIHDSNGRIICEVNYQTDTPNNGWGKNETIEKWKANAQLIATAPKMLEALKLLIDPLTGLCYDGLKTVISNLMMYQIEQVINQATKID